MRESSIKARQRGSATISPTDIKKVAEVGLRIHHQRAFFANKYEGYSEQVQGVNKCTRGLRVGLSAVWAGYIIRSFKALWGTLYGQEWL